MVRLSRVNRWGNVVGLEVGVIIGAAFGQIVTTLVEGIIMPPTGVALGHVDFASLFLVLDASKGILLSPAEAVGGESKLLCKGC